jgi:hypothetical protein
MFGMQRLNGTGRLVSRLVAVVAAGSLMVSASAPVDAVAYASPPGGSYEVLTPTRIVDTRTGLGGVPNGPTRSLVVSTASRAGIPATGVSAIAVNITVTGGAVPGFVTAYPTGSPRPPTSNVNFAQRQTVSQMAVVPVNDAGQFTLKATAPAQLAVDVEGYFTSPDAATTQGLFNPLYPARIMDSRTGFGAVSPGPGGTSVLQVTDRGGVPATGVSAVVINTTITGPTERGYVTAYPTGSRRPATPTITFTPDQTVANRAIVPVGTGGRISFYNAAGTTELLIDVTGYFTDGLGSSTGGYYVPVPVSRVVDTRFWQTSSYMSTRTLKTQKIAGETCVLSPSRTLCGRALVPPITAHPRPIAALLNVTAVPTGVSGYLTAFPADSPAPASSDVNFTDGAAVSSLAFVGLSSRGEVSVHNSGGFANVVEDVCGYFALRDIPLVTDASRRAPEHLRLPLSTHPGANAPASAPLASIAASPGPTPPGPTGGHPGGVGALPVLQKLTGQRPLSSLTVSPSPAVAAPAAPAAPAVASPPAPAARAVASPAVIPLSRSSRLMITGALSGPVPRTPSAAQSRTTQPSGAKPDKATRVPDQGRQQDERQGDQSSQQKS